MIQPNMATMLAFHRHRRGDFARAARSRSEGRRGHAPSIPSPSMATPRRTIRSRCSPTANPAPAESPTRTAPITRNFSRRYSKRLQIACACDRRRWRRRAARDRNRSARRAFRSRRRSSGAHDREFAAGENGVRRRRPQLGTHPRRSRTLRREPSISSAPISGSPESRFAAAAANIPSTSAPCTKKCSRNLSPSSWICAPAAARRACGPATSPANTFTSTPATAPDAPSAAVAPDSTSPTLRC